MIVVNSKWKNVCLSLSCQTDIHLSTACVVRVSPDDDFSVDDKSWFEETSSLFSHRYLVVEDIFLAIGWSWFGWYWQEQHSCQLSCQESNCDNDDQSLSDCRLSKQNEIVSHRFQATSWRALHKTAIIQYNARERIYDFLLSCCLKLNFVLHVVFNTPLVLQACLDFEIQSKRKDVDQICLQVYGLISLLKTET